MPVALSAGITTLITAGFEEPVSRMHRTLEAFEQLPVNVGSAGQRARRPARIRSTRLIEGGSVGLKIHEDWGAYPEIVDATLAAADAHDIAVCLHTDGLNESTELDGTIAAIAGRTIHAYHVEGTGGGHIPDLLGLVREPNVLCSSTTPEPAVGAGRRRRDARHDHDRARAATRWSPRMSPPRASGSATPRMAAEGPLHELGAISIINSDSQGMGRIGETIRRTWQLADAMKRWRVRARRRQARGPGRGRLRPRPDRLERPTTTSGCSATSPSTPREPALVHGVADEVGFARTRPRRGPGPVGTGVRFGVRPLMVIKGGVVAWSAMGEGNASVHGSQPTRYGPDWGATGDAAASLSTTFVSAAALDAGIAATLGRRGAGARRSTEREG